MPAAALAVVAVAFDCVAETVDGGLSAVAFSGVSPSTGAGAALSRWHAAATTTSARIRQLCRTRANLPARVYLAGSIRSRCWKKTNTTSSNGMAEAAQLRRRPQRRVERPIATMKIATRTPQKNAGHR